MSIQRKALTSRCDLKSYPLKQQISRVAEEARLESVYTPKAYREFESRSLRKREEPILSFLYSVFTSE